MLTNFFFNISETVLAKNLENEGIDTHNNHECSSLT